MTAYDTSEPVLVTGATGYVAGWIVRRLLEEGFTVHAAVRNPSQKGKVTHLDALAATLPGKLRYFASDLLEPGSYAEALRGCRVVFHTASPFIAAVDDPQRDLVDPAQLGTRNVLEQAAATSSVTRVVVTSSCAAIYGDNRDLLHAQGPKFTEEDWNTTSSLAHQPYSYSKVVAEREAWRLAEAQDRYRLVTVNPSLVLGPGISPHGTSESFNIIRQLADGTMRAGVPDLPIGVVDVRDVAEQHLRAGLWPDARGRYIASAHDTSFLGIAQSLRASVGDAYPLPRRAVPKWLLWLIGPFVNRAFTRKMVARNVGYPWRGDSSKAIRELGMSYRPLDETTRDMLAQLVEVGVVRRPAG